MKVILNADVKHLGEEGDVKVVANGYARNYLFPRNLALPYNDLTVAYFESRKEEIEAKKEEKMSRTLELNTIKNQALKELGYTEINDQNAAEILEKMAEIQSRKI